MKKSFKKVFNIIIYISFIISVVINIIISRNNILNNNNKILKEMSESNQITDLNKSIEQLNASYTAYTEYIQESKEKIAKAITDMGVETSNDDTLEVVESNIRSIENLSEIKVLASGGGTEGTQYYKYTIKEEDNIKNVIVVISSSNNVIASGAISSCSTNSGLNCESLFNSQTSYKDSSLGDGVQRTAIFLIKDIPIGETITMTTRWMGHYCVIGY